MRFQTAAIPLEPPDPRKVSIFKATARSPRPGANIDYIGALARNIRPENRKISKPINLAALAACTFFVLAGLAFIPLLGIQNDEALFATAIYEPLGMEDFRWVFGRKLPTMVMSYVGALKSWLYTPIFHFWPPSPASLRVPVLLAAAAALLLFFAFFRRAAGPRAALAALILLAADPLFLLTATFDWGPVAIQHLLFGAALFLLLRWHQRKHAGWASLAGGFFLLGLAFWNKAIFSWMLAGLGAASVFVFPREVWRAFTLRRLGVACLAFALGALPLILYNARHRLNTFGSNAALETRDLPGRARLLRYTLEGSALFGWLTAHDSEVSSPLSPRTPLEKASAFLSRAAGRPHTSLAFYAFLAALALLPLLCVRYGWHGPVRAIAFALVFLAVAWLAMALTRGAGGGVHHVILLWPFPAFVTGTAFAAASRLARRGALALALVLAPVSGSQLLVLNEYYNQAVTNGGALNWTDAIYPLARALRGLPADYIFVTDWGILDSLRLLEHGRLPVRVATVPESDPQAVRFEISGPRHLYVGHTAGNEFTPGATARLEAAAAGLGYRRHVLRVISDARGKPFFEIYRFAP